MSNLEISVNTSLVDSLGAGAQQHRRDNIHEASKSMTRFTVLLMLLFSVCWFHSWIVM